MRPIRVLPVILALAGLYGADAPQVVVSNVRNQLATGNAQSVPLAAGADATARARLSRLATTLKAGGWDFSPKQERINGDCAAVVVQGSKPRAGAPDLFALYLVDDGAGWCLLPDPTRPLSSDAARQERLSNLAQWVAEATRPEPITLASGAAATWMMGAATINGQTLRPGAAISMGQVIAVSAAKPGRLIFNELKESSINLSPGSMIALVEDPVADGKDLVIDLQEGAVQVDVHALGAYKHVRVRGVASDVLVTGTIFLVQRVSSDQDYVAQVEGTVKVRKKTGNPAEAVELRGHEGVGVSEGTGVSAVEKLSARPQLTPERLATGNIRDQGTSTSTGGSTDGGWKTDAVQQQAPTVAAVPASTGSSGTKATASTGGGATSGSTAAASGATTASSEKSESNQSSAAPSGSTKDTSGGAKSGATANGAVASMPKVDTGSSNEAPSDIVMPVVAAAASSGTASSGSGPKPANGGKAAGSGTGSPAPGAPAGPAAQFSGMLGVMNPGLGNATGSNPSTSTGNATTVPGASAAGGTTAPPPATPLSGRPGFPN